MPDNDWLHIRSCLEAIDKIIDFTANYKNSDEFYEDISRSI
jgi:hypothetical protein